MVSFLKGHNLRTAQVKSTMELAREKAKKKDQPAKSAENTGEDKHTLANQKTASRVKETSHEKNLKYQ